MGPPPISFCLEAPCFERALHKSQAIRTSLEKVALIHVKSAEPFRLAESEGQQGHLIEEIGPIQ